MSNDGYSNYFSPHYNYDFFYIDDDYEFGVRTPFPRDDCSIVRSDRTNGWIRDQPRRVNLVNYCPVRVTK